MKSPINMEHSENYRFLNQKQFIAILSRSPPTPILLLADKCLPNAFRKGSSLGTSCKKATNFSKYPPSPSYEKKLGITYILC